jgi:DNA repair exonuclease SbcCD nuclease subunit
MKIIHCADLHLDSKMTANLNKEQAKERKNEILRTFVHMVEYADANGVEVILIAGDLFDTRNVSATVRNTVKDTILSHPDIDFLYLKGNHDNDNFLSKLEEIPANLKLFGNEWITYEYLGGRLLVTGLELKADNQAYAYNSLVLPQDTCNIVTLHGQLADYAGKDHAETISLNALKNKNIDYLALGHVHSFKSDRLDARGVYCYSGCLEGRGFDECGPKGFVLLDIDEETLAIKSKVISCSARTLYTIPVDVTGVLSTNETAKRIEQEINRCHYASGSLVKIDLQGELDVECELNLDYLQDLFADYYYCVKIDNRTRLKVRYEDYRKDESLKGEFVRLVLDSDLSEEQKSEVIRCGIMALSGEEI